MNRRRLLAASAAGGGLLLLPSAAFAATSYVNPYSGAIPLVSPLQLGTYQSPVANNWHESREGQLYQWNHRDNRSLRAHDGVDVYPIDNLNLPTAYAPIQGTVAAVCTRSDNTVGATVTYRASAITPPPWNYSQAVDTVANLPMYGNFVWLYSTDPRSAGYFVFVCHLQNDAVIGALAPDQAVDTSAPIGTMGDTGNAQGTPQLHVEIHFPSGKTFSCTHCTPRKSGLTSFDPFASLTNAAVRI